MIKLSFKGLLVTNHFCLIAIHLLKNKIGLTIDDGSNDNFIKTKNDTVLAWPYKDCVLEGGQTKEDDKKEMKYSGMKLCSR